MSLADAVVRNPRYGDNSAYKRLHHQLLARILRDDASFDQALFHLQSALTFGSGADLNMMIVTTYADARNYAAAREHIAKARSNPPFNPLRRFVWNSGLDELEAYIQALDSSTASSTSGAPTL